MMDVGRHPRIHLLTCSEVESVTGFVGNFRVRVRKRARYVREKDCNACGDCAKVCPVTVPDEYQEGLATRKAIYIPYPQAVPSAYIIDMESCLGLNPIACGKCQEVCEKNCIDYDMHDELLDFDVGAIIVATGMEVYDPREMDEYGYTRFANVITSMEFERLINAGGPTEGHFVRPGDMTRPKRIAFIQCVGSRSLGRGHPYCSNICCMNTVKDTLLLKDHYPDTEIAVYYMDIRAFGKGFEDLYRRSRELGVRYFRGLPGRVEEVPGTGNLRIVAENTETDEIEEHEYDLVVLSVGMKPRGNGELSKLLSLSRTSDGFFLEAHPKLKPVDTPSRGVFLAGCAEAPKDIKDSVTQASAAAARAAIILNSDTITLEAITAKLIKEECTACGRCAAVCPFGAIKFVKGSKRPPEFIEAACMGCGACAAECNFDAIVMRHFTDEQISSQISAILSDRPEEKIVVFACNWCSYAGGDYAGVSRLKYPPTARLIRTMCSARVAEKFVWQAFREGAPVVLVSGCHFADCHYINANRNTVRRVERLWDQMERKGMRPERLQLEWISAAEGQKFAVVMREIERIRQTVTPEEIEQTRKILQEEYEKELKKKAARKEKLARITV
jgi:heterodisulfide reductase subunit A